MWEHGRPIVIREAEEDIQGQVAVVGIVTWIEDNIKNPPYTSVVQTPGWVDVIARNRDLCSTAK